MHCHNIVEVPRPQFGSATQPARVAFFEIEEGKGSPAVVTRIRLRTATETSGRAV